MLPNTQFVLVPKIELETIGETCGCVFVQIKSLFVCVSPCVFQRSTETSYTGLPQDTCQKKSGGKLVRAKHPFLSIVFMIDLTQTRKPHKHNNSHQSKRPSSWLLRQREQRPYSHRSIRAEDWRPSVSLGLNALHLSPLWKATAVKAAVKMQSPGTRQAAAAQHRLELNWSPYTFKFLLFSHAQYTHLLLKWIKYRHLDIQTKKSLTMVIIFGSVWSQREAGGSVALHGPCCILHVR